MPLSCGVIMGSGPLPPVILKIPPKAPTDQPVFSSSIWIEFSEPVAGKLKMDSWLAPSGLTT